ncbi:MAG: Calx-beta domain-containing protein, partial [Gammaproteobacteria bacterium]
GSDYTSASGSLSFGAGDTTRSITVNISDDSVAEGNEGFTVGLSNIVDATSAAETISDNSGAGTITDNDSAGLTISATSLSTSETGTTASFTVKLSSQPTADVTVTLTGLDSTEGSLDKTTLTFTPANWNSTQTLIVTGLPDNLDDGDVNYELQLQTSGADDKYSGANSRKQTLQITNTDKDEAPSLSIADVQAREDSGTVQLTITRGGATGGTTRVNFASIDATALATGDFTAISGAVSFAPGETSKSLSVRLTNDDLAEPDEVFLVRLSEATDDSGVRAQLGKDQATVSVADDEAPAALTIGGATVNEQDGTARLVVTRSGALGGETTVRYATAAGTASAEADYEATSGTLVFAAGETSKDIRVPIVDDKLLETRETFDVTLSAATDTGLRPVVLNEASAVVAIVDDEIPLSISIANVEFNEGDGSAQLQVTRSGDLSGTTTLHY